MSAEEARAEQAEAYRQSTGWTMAEGGAVQDAFESGWNAHTEWQASREVTEDHYGDTCWCYEESGEVRPERLPADIRADLIDFAAQRIQAVWDDAGAVTAQVLAENIVAAQEFAWLSHQIPLRTVSREVTAAEVTAAAKAMYERMYPYGEPWERLDRGVRVEYEKDARAALVAAREVRS